MNFFASALTVACLVAIQALPHLLVATVTQWSRHRAALIIGAHGLTTLVSIVLSCFVLRLGARSLERNEF